MPVVVQVEEQPQRVQHHRPVPLLRFYIIITTITVELILGPYFHHSPLSHLTIQPHTVKSGPQPQQPLLCMTIAALARAVQEQLTQQATTITITTAVQAATVMSVVEVAFLLAAILLVTTLEIRSLIRDSAKIQQRQQQQRSMTTCPVFAIFSLNLSNRLKQVQSENQPSSRILASETQFSYMNCK